ncbi:MAG: DNA mismatch repair endonuclease MutL [Lachnospiraceae bacterium]|nr:DNA mismatch repair endonuclease MutL [Lachnospiraceae bacterium]
MDRNIIVLDKATIDKIAAGEVVERPMSVVKELVENSIDAGADAITVEIKDGGISYIRVTDNGTGIPKDQVRTAFLRHATSKIRSIEDLISVGSLGFRGEALSSIASVSKVELLTKTADDYTGTRYIIEGSKELSFDDVGIPDGTSFIVRHLFYNTPARRKFLKTAQTEAGYVSDFMEKIMLSHPETAFKLIVNNTTKLQSSGNGEVADIIYSLYGRDMSAGLIPIESGDGDVKISGFVCRPELARGNRSFEIYFVNRRYIQSTLIRRALDEAYKPYLMLHKYPVVILYFEISPELIDVNVHPSKKEIRFYEGNSLYDLLVKSIRNKLSEKELIVDIHENEKNTGQINISRDAIRPEPFERKTLDSFAPKSRPEAPESTETTYVEAAHSEPDHTKTDHSKTDHSETFELQSFNDPVRPQEEKPVQLSMFEDGFLSTEGIKKHRMIGQLFETYWLIEMDNKLYIIDQHAAHEKVKYERILKQYESGSVSSQLLNPPIVVTLTKAEEAVVSAYAESFRRVGFEIEPFGGNEYSIREIPTELFGLTPSEYFHDLLDELMNDKRSKNIDAVDHRIATMACKSAVKGNTSMSLHEAEALIDELMTLDNPFNCPHGRPTIVSFTKSEVEKMFKRIV